MPCPGPGATISEKPMTLQEFNATAVRTNNADEELWDLRPFGDRQSEALEFWLGLAQTQGDPFGKAHVVKVEASLVLSQYARDSIAKLQEKSIVIGIRRE